MEKLRYAREKQFCNRLLKILFFSFFIFSFNAFSVSYSVIKSIVIKPEQNVFFTNQELKYILEIPDIEPMYVQTELQQMKEGVTFVSSRRMEYYSNDNVIGTRIEFWFSFKDPGIADILPLIVRINGSVYYLPFEKVQIYENPKTIAPVVSVELNSAKIIYPLLENSKKKNEVFESLVTEPIDINIYIQYATQIKQFGYEIPKDSIFEELERFEILNSKTQSTEFSNEKIPVAKFRWIPLKEGNFSLPNIRLIATAYSGRNLELGLPECRIIVKNKTKDNVEKNDENFSIFAYALSTPIEEKVTQKVKIPTEQDFHKMAQLRSKEKRSLFFLQNRKARVEFEASFGIVSSRKEVSVPLWNIVFAIFIILLSSSIILFILKKRRIAIILFCFAIIAACATIIFGKIVNEKHGIVSGGSISPVPEETALSSTAVTSGTCVLIKQETPLWYYIEYNENGGWIKKSNLILVK